MATGNITVAAVVQGSAAGTWSLNTMGQAFTAPSAVFAETLVALISGATTVNVPTGSTAVILVPPNSSYPQPNPNWAGTLTLKGVTGDTGVPLSTKYVTEIPWDSATAPASFVITSTATGTMTAVFM